MRACAYACAHTCIHTCTGDRTGACMHARVQMRTGTRTWPRPTMRSEAPRGSATPAPSPLPPPPPDRLLPPPTGVQWQPCTVHRVPNNEHQVHMHPRLKALHAHSITCDSECGSSGTDATRHGMHAAAAAVCCTHHRIFFAVSAGLLYSTGRDRKNELRQLSEATTPGSETGQYVPCTCS